MIPFKVPRRFRIMLSNSQKRYLRGLAHELKPVILTGNKGLTPALIQEFSGALDHHERRSMLEMMLYQRGTDNLCRARLAMIQGTIVAQPS